jgi:hypothetical protein
MPVRKLKVPLRQLYSLYEKVYLIEKNESSGFLWDLWDFAGLDA